jgi:hypothetical protein
MEEAYPHRLILDVRQAGHYSVYGHVAPSKDGTLRLDDGSGTISLTGCPPNLAGLVEVRGVCERAGWLEARSYVVFGDDSFDTAEYAKIVGVFTKANSDFAAWTIHQDSSETK